MVARTLFTSVMVELGLAASSSWAARRFLPGFTYGVKLVDGSRFGCERITLHWCGGDRGKLRRFRSSVKVDATDTTEHRHSRALSGSL
jgi:predicted metal-binding protein